LIVIVTDDESVALSAKYLVNCDRLTAANGCQLSTTPAKPFSITCPIKFHRLHPAIDVKRYK